MNYNEEEKIHEDITFEDFIALPEERLNNGQIYFITDVSSQAQFLTRLIGELKTATQELQTIMNEIDETNGGGS